MKVKRFLGTTIKNALAQVKERLGNEAVILSNRATPEGVEVLAVAGNDIAELTHANDRDVDAAAPPPGFAIDFGRGKRAERAAESPVAPRIDPPGESRAEPRAAPRSEASALEAAFRAAPVERTATIAADPPAAAPPAAPGSAQAFDFVAFLRQAGREHTGDALRPAGAAGRPGAPTRDERPVATPPAIETAPATQPPASADALAAELRALRGLMEDRFAAMTLANDLRRRPLAGTLMRELLAAGFSTTLARAAVNALDGESTPARAREWLERKLVQQLQVAAGPHDDIVERGGVYALTGPTGVGKTTTTAKLAARCVVRHGASRLGLISTDTYRIGAQDQLRVFGKILGVPVHAVHDALGLEQTLAQLRDKHLVLIDTIGLGQRDERVAEGVAMLEACGVRRLVLLAATSQVETLDDVCTAYAASATNGAAAAAGAILTKIDEAAKLGGALDVILRHRLYLHFVGTGQRVPEDIELPDARALVSRALQVPRGGPFALTRDEAALLATAGGLDLVFTRYAAEAQHA